MAEAFGESRTIPASDTAKKIMKELAAIGVVKEQRDLWTMGAALGLSLGQKHEEGKRETFQNINSLDPEDVFQAIMLGLYPDKSPEERLRILVDHAEWGIREIYRKYQNGTLDWSKLGTRS